MLTVSIGPIQYSYNCEALKNLNSPTYHFGGKFGAHRHEHDLCQRQGVVGNSSDKGTLLLGFRQAICDTIMFTLCLNVF